MTELYEICWNTKAYVYADSMKEAEDMIWTALREAKKVGCYAECTSDHTVEKYDDWGLGVKRCKICGEPVSVTESWDGHPVYNGEAYCESCIETLLKDELEHGIVARKYYPAFCTGFDKDTYVVKNREDLERQIPPDDKNDGTIYVSADNMLFYYRPGTDEDEEWWGGAFRLRGDKDKIKRFLSEFPKLHDVWSHKEEEE